MRKKFMTLACAALAVGAFCIPAPVFGQTNPQYSYADLHNFGSYTDGENPYSGVTFHSGNLFGTAEKGGGQGQGMVWSFTASGTYADLLDIAAPYGLPEGGVTFDTSGNMWGTTYAGPGGTTFLGSGSVWELTTSSAMHYSAWSAAIEANEAGVTIGPNGYKYGTSSVGGVNGRDADLGTVWAVKSTNGFQEPQIIHTFGTKDDKGNPLDGWYPTADVTFDSQGNMYGTCSDGGTNYITTNAFGSVYGGIVWEITASGEYKILHDFGGTVTNANGSSGRDGYAPYAGVTLDSAGNLYGTTYAGGPINVGNDGCGMVWEITASGVYKDLHDFGGTVVNANGKTGTDGINPRCSVKFDALGNMYGTTQVGGPNAYYQQGYALQGGIVWQIRPGPNGYVDLHDFGGRTTFDDGTSGDDGYSPYAGVTLTSTGQIYGTTERGGRFEYGMLWVLSAPYTGAISSLTVSPTAVNEGSSATGTVTLAAAAPPGGAFLALLSDNGDAAVPHSILVPGGATTATFTITTSFVSAQTVANISVGGLARGAQLTINPPALDFMTINPGTVVGGNPAAGTVTLSAPAGPGGLGVALTSQNSAASVPSVVTVPQGKQTAKFTMSSFGVDTATNVPITGSLYGTTLEGLVTVVPASLSSITLSPSTVVGGNLTTGTVTLNGQAGSKGSLVSLSCNSAAVLMVSSVMVPTGLTSATFSIGTTGVSSQTTPTITATFNGKSQTAVLTITPAGISSLTVNPTSFLGGNSSTGTVTLTGLPTSGGVTVTLSSNSTFATVPASVTVPSGQSSTTFNVASSPVSTETAATISATFNGQSRAANLTIDPAGVQALRINPTFVQGGSSSSGTVTLAGPAGPSGILVGLSNTTSFSKVPSTITVLKGQTTATFTISTSPVSSQTRDTLTAVANHGSASTVLVITPATLTGLSINPISIVGGNSATGTVTLSGPAGPNEVVSLTSSNPAANVTAVTVPVGLTSASFTITTHGVGATVKSIITGTFGGQTQSAALTINPAQLVGLTIAPSQVLGGVSSTGTLTLNGEAAPAGIVVALSSSSIDATVPKTVTIPSGQSLTTFAIPTLPVSAVETVTVTAKSGSFSTHASLKIVPAAVISVSFNPSSVAGGAPSTGTVTLSGPAGASGMVISLKSDSVSAKPETTQFVIAKGQTTGTFKVNTVGGAVSTTATITATATVNSSWAAARLTIGPVAIQSVTFNPSSVVGGNSSNVTVKLTGPAPVGGLTVSLSSNSSSASLTATSLKIAGGLTSAETVVKTVAVAVNTTATITATLGAGSLSGSLQILAPKLVSLSLDPSSVTGGSLSRGTVSISSAAPVGGLTISVSSDSSRALPNTNVVIPAGKTSASFQILTTFGFSRVTATIKASFNGASVSAVLTIHT